MTHANAIHVFVYGTLRAGETNDSRVAATKHGIPEPELPGTATLHGRLYDFGAYLGLVLDPIGTAVCGDVYRIDTALVPVLDEIEEVYPGGDVLFPRKNHPVMLGDEPADRIVYPVSPQYIVGRPVTTGGDWMAHCLSRD